MSDVGFEPRAQQLCNKYSLEALKQLGGVVKPKKAKWTVPASSKKK